MFNGLSMFNMASASAEHATARQTEIARNIANAHTPGYLARDIPDFDNLVPKTAASTSMRSTRAGHLSVTYSGASPWRAETDKTDLKPNGNSVSIESEMMKASEVRLQHQMALSVYRSGIDLLRSGLGRGR